MSPYQTTPVDAEILFTTRASCLFSVSQAGPRAAPAAVQPTIDKVTTARHAKVATAVHPAVFVQKVETVPCAYFTYKVRLATAVKEIPVLLMDTLSVTCLPLLCCHSCQLRVLQCGRYWLTT